MGVGDFCIVVGKLGKNYYLKIRVWLWKIYFYLIDLFFKVVIG